ncbi:MAG: hypothetical protein KAQ62_18875, partial [Cyclobacteriaceae bacterium]|nr:hypothetical protein [Cyclobacteriaceae bacterium]
LVKAYNNHYSGNVSSLFHLSQNKEKLAKTRVADFIELNIFDYGISSEINFFQRICIGFL